MSTQPNTPSSAKISSAETSDPKNAAGANNATEQLVTIRRAPSLLAFAITGAIIGAILALIITFIPWPTSADAIDQYTTEYSVGSVVGVLLVVGATLGAAIASVIALILDRRSAKNPETVRAIPTEDDTAQQA